MTRGRAATPDPIDIGAVSRSGELFDALAARRPTDLGDDPAARLLAALVADVDVGAPPLPAPVRVSCAKTGSRRRTVRVVVTLGVTAAVLTTAGAAVAGGGGDGSRGADGARAPRVSLSERTNGSLQVSTPERSVDRRPIPAESRFGDGHRSNETHPHRYRAGKRLRDHHDHEVVVSDPTPELQNGGEPTKDAGSPTALPSPSPSVSEPHGQP